jgi:hypothetical protein
MQAIENDTYEAAISMSRGLWKKREALFDQMNP